MNLYNHDIEKSVLSCFFKSSQVADTYMDMLTIHDFTNDTYKDVYKAVDSVYRKGRGISLLTVTDELGEDKGVVDIARYEPSASKIADYISILQEYTARRKMVKICQRGIQKVEDGADYNEIMLKMKSAFEDMVVVKDGDLTEVNQSILDGLQASERRQNGEEVTIRTFYPSIDNMLSGFGQGSLVVMAGRPGSGKTALSMNMAINMARYGVHKVLFFSREMASVTLGQRIASYLTRVPYKKIRDGKLSDDDKKAIIDASCDNIPLTIDDNPSKSVAEMKAVIIEQKPEVVFIDYLQLIDGKGENRNQEISKITRALKLIAMELKIVVVLLSQLSRKSEERKGHPKLSDLRDSGAIEQDANVVMFVHRPILSDEDADERQADIIIAKARESKTGTVELRFYGETVSFREVR